MPGPNSTPHGRTANGRVINGKTAMRAASVKSWRTNKTTDDTDKKKETR